MLSNLNHKNKVELADYNYKRDIENRLLVAEFSVLEVDVLREILNSSLKISEKTLAEILEIPSSTLLPILDKLEKTKLLSHQNGMITVDKEMRKYYESQIIKFDEDFEPGIEYLQGLLSKVPIHVLPVWYSISRSTDHIFNSIIEKYLLTPKIYERYLSELQFNEPIMNGIFQDVISAPDFKIYSSDLRTKYNLSPEVFEEYMLHLEFNFVCCLSYSKVGDVWKEVVTPFHEWREYLSFLRDNTPKPIEDSVNIRRKIPHDFGFVQDISALLKVASQTHLSVKLVHNEHTLLSETLRSWVPHLANEPSIAQQEYVKNLVCKLLQLQLAQVKDGQLKVLGDLDADWNKKPLQDQAMMVYRHATLRDHNKFVGLSVSDRDIREAEKSLKRVINKGWVYLEDFMKGLTAPIGNAEQTTLKNKGKRWKYTLPLYSDEERRLVELTICERLLEVGMVAIGTHNGKCCFSVTPFGGMSIGD